MEVGGEEEELKFWWSKREKIMTKYSSFSTFVFFFKKIEFEEKFKFAWIFVHGHNSYLNYGYCEEFSTTQFRVSIIVIKFSCILDYY